MSHSIWFSAESSRKRDLVSEEEEKRRKREEEEVGKVEAGAGWAGQMPKTKGSLFLVRVEVWTERRGGGVEGVGEEGVRRQGGNRVTAAMCEANEERAQGARG